MKTEATKTIIYIAGAMIAFATTIVAVERYFAKAESVEVLTERVDVGMSNDQIFQQQQAVRHWEAETKFEKRAEPPTATERSIIEQERDRLKELEQRRLEKIESYKRRK